MQVRRTRFRLVATLQSGPFSKIATVLSRIAPCIVREPMSDVSDKLIAGLIMNIVAQEERHLMRDAALRGMDLNHEDTVDHVYANTVANVVKRFPDEIQEHIKSMLAGDGLRASVKTDLQRHADAAWMKK